jgi:tetratricopeptide (TPR) repeat protein/serine/threonine protein kinase
MSSSSEPSADRNLLLAILALQMDFIRRETLVGIVNAWVLDRHQSFSQLLSERGHLDAEVLHLLESLVEKHLQTHQGDARQSLASLRATASVPDELERLTDPSVQAGPSVVDPAQTTTDHGLNGGLPEPLVRAAGTRYRVVRPYARGGLGEVFIALDQEVPREVALKEIRKERAHNSDSRGRFVLEAEITGGLEHPGIVPVYGMGRYADGRPFYAMRFIQGVNLKEAIDCFHAGRSREPSGTEESAAGHPEGRAAPTFQSLSFRQLLGRFVAVCNTVAYAHSRGVLHRDLKPGNIMLGKFGETLVVDWGLAKLMGRPEAAGHEDRSLCPGSAESSLAATHMGSAVGTPAYMSPEQADGRLDLLGPASDVYSLGATLYTLLTGQPPFSDGEPGDVLPRVRRGDLVLPRAIEPDVPPPLEAICLRAMALRPEHRYVTALDLAADIEHWLADEPVSAYPEPRTVKLGRWIRRHKPLVAGVAAALLVSVLGGSAALVWQQQAQAHQAAAAAALALEQSRKQAETEQAVREALRRARDVHAALRTKLSASGGVFEMLNDPARWQGNLREAGAQLGRADLMRERSGVEINPQLVQESEALRQALDSDEQEHLLAQQLDRVRLDRSTWSGRRFQTQRAAQDYPKVFAAAGFDVTGGDPEQVAARIRASAIREHLVAALDDWSLVARSRDNREEARKLLGRLLHVIRLADPDPWRNRLRDVKLWSDGPALTRMSAQAPLNQLSPQIIVLMGRLLSEHGLDSVNWLRRGQLLHPSDFWINFSLAGDSWSDGQLDEAEAYYRAALAIRPRSSAAWTNLGGILQSKGEIDEAESAYRKAIASNPSNAVSWLNLGTVHTSRGQEHLAIPAYRKAIEIEPGYVKAYLNLGRSLSRQKNYVESERSYRKALDLAARNHDALLGLGDVLNRQRKFAQAESVYRQAIDFDPKKGDGHNGLGIVYYDQNRLAEAEAAFRKAIELDGRFASGWLNLGNVLRKKKAYDEAGAAYRKAIALDPRHAGAHNGLGIVLASRNKLSEAMMLFRKAIQLDPGLAAAHDSLGVALASQKRYTEALPEQRKAIALDPSAGRSYSNLAGTLYELKRYDEAIAMLRKAVALDPDDATAWHNLGENLSRKESWSEAEAAYRRAIQIDPHIASAHVGLGNVFLSREEYDAAADAYRKFIDLVPRHSMGHYNLGLAILNQGDVSGSLVHFRRSLKLAPPGSAEHKKIARRIEQCERLRVLDQKLAAILEGKAQPNDVAEQLALADLCRRYKGLYRAAVRLYADALPKSPGSDDVLRSRHRYYAACAAALAAAGKGKDTAEMDEAERARLRRQALSWLEADLNQWSKEIEKENVWVVQLVMEEALPWWRKDARLSGMRDEKELARLTAAERQTLSRFWSRVDQAEQEARSRFTEARQRGALSEQHREKVHPHRLHACRPCVIDLVGAQPGATLRLEDDKGNKLAASESAGREDKPPRIVFTPQREGMYHIIASSAQQEGQREHEIVIREFVGKK